MNKAFFLSIPITVAMLSPLLVQASGDHVQGIHSKTSPSIRGSFDIVQTRITTEGRVATFQMSVSSSAGKNRPAKTGKLEGSEVFSYVWPTSLNSAEVGFEKDAGILALAVTAHPDFDDTPLYDENGDNDTSNDGALWHSHWVVLKPDDACGAGALGVVDIPEGTHPKLPKTWPGFSILLDSPGWDPSIGEKIVEVKVAFDDIGAVEGSSFDGVTAGLRVNQHVHAPLLCVVNVMDVASGDFSLPGKVNQ